MSVPNSGMTIHTLVLTVDSFSYNCNSIGRSMSKGLQEHFSLSSSYCCMCINTSVFSNVTHFNFVQQCIQISTRINSSMYICTSVFVSFETYPIFNMVQENFSLSSNYCCMYINTSVFSNVTHFNFVQQCIQISTRINSSMYIRTSVFLSFKTYPIFNMLSE